MHSVRRSETNICSARELHVQLGKVVAARCIGMFLTLHKTILAPRPAARSAHARIALAPLHATRGWGVQCAVHFQSLDRAIVVQTSWKLSHCFGLEGPMHPIAPTPSTASHPVLTAPPHAVHQK
jgi:hypothetical protein